VWQGLAVPDILLSGHHQKIAAWKLEQAEQLTKQRRTDLWQNYLANYKKNYKND
jgi:tRNA (guanine37-N1)-methyltransferase